MLRLLGLLLLFSLIPPNFSLARSVYTPRDSGTEPPGGPRSATLPTPSNFGRTQEGGLGYTDAYGNTISSEVPEPKPHKRLPKGAYGQYGAKDQDDRPLPDLEKSLAKPVWNFR